MQLKEYPAALCSLGLSLLDLSNNDLSSLPAELGEMDLVDETVLGF
jgi:Leucine-rich repeat (LRR) protein